MQYESRNLELPLGRAKVSKKSLRKRVKPLAVAGLFAGIGGVERGLERSGHHAPLLCEIDDGARVVLHKKFPGIPVHGDVRTLKRLPKDVEMITGGFPCQDLSQAGKAEGILKGKRSGLVTEIFRLVQKMNVPWVLLENVPFMLQLDQGRAMGVLADAFETLGYKWAYRVVNSRAFGVPQRRERVIFLATHAGDPREVLLTDEEEEPQTDPNQVGRSACGFYWTEGLRGLGWAVNSVPTLKGGSAIGIPSPPAILLPDGRLGTPDIRDAERMQGFPMNWTAPALKVSKPSHRWQLVGNAVTVGVFEWVGKRLVSPDPSGASVAGWKLHPNRPWTDAGWNVGEGRYGASMSRFPRKPKIIDFEKWLRYPLKPLSEKATSGFLSRAERAKLRFPVGFLDAVRAHRKLMQEGIVVTSDIKSVRTRKGRTSATARL